MNNIDSIEGIYTLYDQICDDEKNYTDQELSDKLNDVLQVRCGNNPSRSIFFVHHYRSEQLVKRRATQYCKQHHIKLEDYNGSLPFRKFLIGVDLNKQKDRRLKIEKIMKSQKQKRLFSNIKIIWKHIFKKIN